MNTMTSSAQEYLSQVRLIDEQMRIIQSQISNIVELSGMSYDSQPGSQSDKSKTEKLAMRRLELLEKYEKKRNELIHTRYQITDMILTLRGQYQQEILFKRYVELKRWKRIAREMSLSERMVFNVHREALQLISERLQ